MGFFWLLCYVAWPYTAVPARTWPGWIPTEVDAAAGTARVAAAASVDGAPAPGALVYAIDTATTPPTTLGRFVVTAAEPDALALRLDDAADGAARERLAASLGPWSLGEQPPGAWPSHYADDLARKEWLPAESLLSLDPLASLSAVLAGRAWVRSLAWTAGILLVGLVVPRAFCGYICPLGTLIDLFDRFAPRAARRFHVAGRGWWNTARFALLGAVLVAAVFGVTLAGFVAAIPLVTRGAVLIVSPLQLAAARDWGQVPAWSAAHWTGVFVLGAVVSLGVLGPRFWCRCLCPTGALFSLAGLLSPSRRTTQPSCIACQRCRRMCTFDAIDDDYRTRRLDCVFCQDCAGVCPTGAIRFAVLAGAESPATRAPVEPDASAPTPSASPTERTAVDRRAWLRWTAVAAATVAAGAGAAAALRAARGSRAASVAPPLRPPGSLPETDFLALCVRCGACFQACPNNVLQPMGLDEGIERLWTPAVVADQSGCDPSCANCGQVCPTGAIRPLVLDEKRFARIGLAEVDAGICLPLAVGEPCRLCVDECRAAGYDAIDLVRLGRGGHPGDDPAAAVLGETALYAPVVRPDRCVGCGLCQARCHHINVKTKRRFGRSAIRVVGGEGKEDRFRSGSYRALDERHRPRPSAEGPISTEAMPPDAENRRGGYLPGFLQRPE